MTTPANTAGAERYELWRRYLEGVLAAVESGGSAPLGPLPSPPVPPAIARAPADGPPVVYCAPHPDDESLSGALALRLRLEDWARVTNIAITLGSDVGQRERRRRELTSACQALGFDLVITREPGSTATAGFERITFEERQANLQAWARRVAALAELFDGLRPEAVFTPHAEDFNTTHIGTHYLVVDALGRHLAGRPEPSVMLIETEIWHQLAEPNLMVAVTPEVAALQLVAATEHGDEMRRNPYHLLHACRLMDNLRRGSEVVCGQGAAAQPFPMAELYRVSRWPPPASKAAARAEVGAATGAGGRVLGPAEPATLAWLRREFSN